MKAAEFSLDELRSRHGLAQNLLLCRQADDGSWKSAGFTGPGETARTVLALHYLGRGQALDQGLLSDIVTFLLDRQCADGSFRRYPEAASGDPGTTASVWACLECLNDPRSTQARAKARTFVDANGGLAAVANACRSFDIDGYFVAMAGLLDPALLPEPPGDLLLLPGLAELAARHMNAFGVYILPCVSALVHRLRGDPRGLLARALRGRAVELVTSFQNPSGSFNEVVSETGLALAGLLALGVAADDPRIERGTDWMMTRLRLSARPGGAIVRFSAFPTTVWTTALSLRALLAGGLPRSHPSVERAVDWLVAARITQRPPPTLPLPSGSPGMFGWGFERANVTTADCDDTAVVLAALGMALAGNGSDALAEPVATRARDAVQRGLAWLLPMQNSDGGWPAFQHGLPGKPRGPMLTEYPALPVGIGLKDLCLLGPPYRWMFGDPSTEDITARTLRALAECGFTCDAPEVQEALAFLEAQQCTLADLGGAVEQGEGGAFWSRWICNYVAATGYVLGGYAAVQADLQQAWFQRAVRWLKRRQNPDGGWGEDARSYAQPSLAGSGESAAALTGLALTGLLDAGEFAATEVGRGIAYLLARQLPNGDFPPLGAFHVFYKTNTFYTLLEADLYYPLEAMGRYLAISTGKAPRVVRGDVTTASLARAASLALAKPRFESGAARPTGTWSDALLDEMRTLGDPVADAVVEAIFAEGQREAVDALLSQLVRSDEPVPAGLPAAVRSYFETTAALPPCYDAEAVERAEAIFARWGFTTAAALFHSSLPQLYAAKRGVQVLLGTRGLLDHAERRIFETAQFLLDVLSPGAFGPEGRAVRAAQKVRLLHAAIRRLTLLEASYDLTCGVPINQEDLAGTLMTFSVVVLDAFRRFGIDLPTADEDAFVLAWNVTGSLLGVRAELLPRDAADGRALMSVFRRRNWSASEPGRALAAALVQTIARLVPELSALGATPALIRDLAGDRCADLLGVSPANWTEALFAAERKLEQIASALAPAPEQHDPLRGWAFALMRAIVQHERSGKQTRFRVPPALIHAWNLND